MTPQNYRSAEAFNARTLNELAVHVACGGIRGPIGRFPALCDCDVYKGVWQSCPCETTPVQWEGCDVSRAMDLCVLCARATAGGTTRWSWLACGECRAVVRAAVALGLPPLPLGRHSIMNGAAIRLPRSRNFAGEHSAIIDMSNRWSELRGWTTAEIRRLAEARGWQLDAQVLLRTWLDGCPSSRSASRDAYERFVGVTWPESSLCR